VDYRQMSGRGNIDMLSGGARHRNHDRQVTVDSVQPVDLTFQGCPDGAQLRTQPNSRRK
jgi:hypothetical protein